MSIQIYWSHILNSLTPKSVLTGMKNSREGFWLAKHKNTNIPTMSRFPLQRHGFDGWAYTTPGSLRGRVVESVN